MYLKPACSGVSQRNPRMHDDRVGCRRIMYAVVALLVVHRLQVFDQYICAYNPTTRDDYTNKYIATDKYIKLKSC